MSGPPEPGSVSRLPEPARCAAGWVEAELDWDRELRRHPLAAAATEPSSPAASLFPVPFPFRVPAALQARPAAWVGWAALRQAVEEVAWDVVAGLPQAAEAASDGAAAVSVRAALQEAEQQEVRGAPAERPWVLPSAAAWAAAWVFRRDPTPPLPAPRPSAWSVRAMVCLRTAWP